MSDRSLIIFVGFIGVIAVGAWKIVLTRWAEKRRRELVAIAAMMPIDQEHFFVAFIKKHIEISRKELVFLLYAISHEMHLDSRKTYSLLRIHHLIFDELSKHKPLSENQIENIHMVYKDILHTKDVYELVGLLAENKQRRISKNISIIKVSKKLQPVKN